MQIVPQRDNDHHIMSLWSDEPQFSKKNLREVNMCRIIFQAIMVSDIVTTDGEEVKECFLKGLRKVKIQLIWPNISKPVKYAWTQWRLYLKNSHL